LIEKHYLIGSTTGSGFFLGAWVSPDSLVKFKAKWTDWLFCASCRAYLAASFALLSFNALTNLFTSLFAFLSSGRLGLGWGFGLGDGDRRRGDGEGISLVRWLSK